MIINFGWLKETRPIRPIFGSYCYHCQKSTTWHLWRETEWVMFFGIKTIPFLWKNFLVCPGCEYVFHLPWTRYLEIDSEGTRRAIGDAIEKEQLRPKNELQRRFLLTQRAEREARGKRAPDDQLMHKGEQ